MVMTKKIYKEIAKIYGVAVEEVEREMQAAIDAAYIDPTFHAKCVDLQGEKPTTEEFIAHIVRRAKAQGQ